ncbi:AAA family ATPase [Rhodanobacter sp. MP7CTX1]|uniref:AAA family ATPase n=1 Tax=Rhodanobacter sp. MP7CTX1 TaxID=2723084 RepID=UPI001615CB9A|nr:AAA family ATPase [Rhodanobacter sp. MP7CTX1]MBB6187556.1 putative ester cyclase [Rhodanobacter sp. MP7CTX1]
MSLPNIDFKNIRLHGSQADAFEELCCQLASDEPSVNRVGFDRKGRGGDAGAECFETLRDGSETGWQVKYYWDVDSMLRSLDGSLDIALAKHPNMTRFVACFPFDLADARKKKTASALTKWNEWCQKWTDKAAGEGRTIEIERWGAHELKQRLTTDKPRAAGRIAFWFDCELLTPAWFEAAFERTKAALGNRYDPETHVDLPIRRAILATTLEPAFFEELGQFANAIAEAVPANVSDDMGTRQACATAAQALRAAAASPMPLRAETLRRAVEIAATAALNWHGILREADGTREPSGNSRVVSNLLGRLREVLGRLRQPHWDLLGAKSLLISGDAGSGKSHLLADACAYQLARDRPALMVLGGKLADAEPWGQILNDLDLPRHLQIKQFLGALNAAGEAARVCILIAIDALNEKNGQTIWPDRLAEVLHDTEQFPWIAVVLSCRTTYLEVVIPQSLDATKLPRIEHRGFSIGAVRSYLKQRGVTLPEAPLQADELRTPLFLRIYCDALEIEGEALLARGLGSVTDIFRAYSDAVVRKVHREMGVAPNRRLAHNALAALAGEMADTGRAEIPYERADEIVRAIHDGPELVHDLLFQLESEGLLATEPMYGETVQAVRFTFERIGDHAIAQNLIDRSFSHDPSGLCIPETPLHAALYMDDSQILFGLLEALAIQLPERFGLELPDLSGVPSDVPIERAFRESLQTRRIEAIGERTWELVNEVGGSDLRYGTLIALATEPNHPFNVRHLDAELRGLGMPERDAVWSTYLARKREEPSLLIDWVRSADQAAVPLQRAELTAIQLAWFLTSTNRVLRDKATKALVTLLADRPALAQKIWLHFSTIDDGYVTERIAAALYGAALQGRWSDADLHAASQMLRSTLFAAGAPPTNVLLRDHAAGLIRCAAMRGVLPAEFDISSTQPPYASPWPIEYVSDDTVATFTRMYGNDGALYPDEIASSCDDGDFARYVLDYAVQKWSPALRGTQPLPTYADLRNAWYADFTNVASVEALEAYDTLVAAVAAIHGARPIYGEAKDKLQVAKDVFGEVVGSEIFEDWRARAEYWRDDGMYQSMARRGPAEFNLAWARRWVAWRAHDLGWSQTLHGEFDRGLRSGRTDHGIERIGKKYQWLALYELVARMGDNLEPLLDEREDGPERLRNIDPSMLRERTEDDGWRQFNEASFWIAPSPKLEAQSPAETLAWLHSSDAILDGVENVEVTNGDDGQRWLVLTGFENWRGGPEHARCDAWRRVGCVVVRATDRDSLLSLLGGLQMIEHHAMPIAAGGGFHMHLGEHPWAWPDPEETDGWIVNWRPRGLLWDTPGIPVRPPTAEYMAETGGYDYSIERTINLNLPAGWLMKALGLRLSDGRSIEYRNDADEVVFMDPSVARAGRSAALIERAAFLDLLAREGLVAIWAVAGEKNAYGKPQGEGFGGRHTYTRVFYSKGAEIQALSRANHFDEPTTHQLAAFLEMSDTEHEDDDDDFEVDTIRTSADD